MGFSRQEYQSGLPCPPPRDRPNPGMEPASLKSFAFTGRFFTTNHPRSVQFSSVTQLCEVPNHPSSVKFSHSFVSDSLPPHGLQHARLPCPSPTLGAYSNSCPSCQWCHPIISSSVVSSSSHLQSFPASGSFPRVGFRIRWPKYWHFSFSISLSDEYSGLISFRMDWLDLLAVQGTLKSLLQHHSSKASILWCSAFLYSPTLISIYDHWKSHSFD